MRALIVGGDIAGPAVAMALQRVGIEPVVVERRPAEHGEEGSVFTVSSNGLAVLDALDALDAVRGVGFATRTNIMRSATGRTLGEVPLGRPLADGTPALTFKRTRLAAGLVQEALSRGIEVRHGLRAIGFEDGDDGVEVELEDGSRLTADLVVGADGVHSRVRRALDGSAPAARYVGLTNFGGITRATRYARDLPEEAWHFVFGRRSFFGAHRTPSGDVVWFANVPRGEISRSERAATTRERWQAGLVELASVDDGPFADLIAHGELELAGDNTYDLPHVPVWHGRRMVLIGDAAHAPSPSSGQGASLALEDALVLAKALRDNRTVDEAFAAFERVRRPRVERIVKAGARSSSAKIPGPAGRVVRDAVIRLVFRAFVTERSTAWMYDHRVGWDEPVSAG